MSQYSMTWLRAVCTGSECPSPPPEDPPFLLQQRLGDHLRAGRAHFQTEIMRRGAMPPPRDVVANTTILLSSPLVSGLARRQVVVRRSSSSSEQFGSTSSLPPRWDRLTVLRTLDATRLICFAPAKSNDGRRQRHRPRQCDGIVGPPESTMSRMVELDVDECHVFLLTKHEDWPRHLPQAFHRRLLLEQQRHLRTWSSFGSSSGSDSEEDEEDEKEDASSDDDWAAQKK